MGVNKHPGTAAKQGKAVAAGADDCTAVSEPCGSCHARPFGLCASLIASQLDRVAHDTDRLRLSGQDSLFQSGTPADTVYFVASGALKLYQLLSDGRRQIVAFPYPGDFLGYGVNALHSFTAEALTETLLCRFPRPVFNQLLADLPDLQQALQHFPDLFLVCIAIAGNGLFNFPGRIFCNRYPCLHGCGNGHSLRPPQFQHALHIFSKKRSFDGKILRSEFFDELTYFFVDELQPLVRVFSGRQFQHIHLHQLNPALADGYQTIAHQQSAWVDP